MASAEAQSFLAHFKKVVDRLPDKRKLFKTWVVDQAEVLKGVLSVRAAASEFTELGASVAIRLGKESGGPKLQLLLVAARQLQKAAKKLMPADGVGENPFPGLPLKELEMSHDDLEPLLKPDALVEAVHFQAKECSEALTSAEQAIVDLTHGVHDEEILGRRV